MCENVYIHNNNIIESQLSLGHISGVSKDKFLIMSTVMDASNESKDNSSIWKTIPKSNIYEQRFGEII